MLARGNRSLSQIVRTPGCSRRAGVLQTGRLPRTLQQNHSLVVSMGLKTGIVGLPNVGKSTLFNAMVENGKAESANYPFCTIEPNVGLVLVPDSRLDVLTELSSSQKTIPTTVEFVDIAGLVKGASQGEGLGNKFLSHIREVDVVVQVVRCFEDENIVHVNGTVDPVSDIDTINIELGLRDIDQIEQRKERLKKGRAKDKAQQEAEALENAALDKLLAELSEGKVAREVDLTDEELEVVKPLCLLTLKPVIYAANVGEDELASEGADNVHVKALRQKAADEGAKVVVVSAAVEAELKELDADERAEYLDALGVEEGGLGNLIRNTYDTLGLRTYFTTGEKETRAWTIKAGFTAPQAAGVIHTDFERGFICADTVAYNDFVEGKTLTACKEAGKLRQEGKEYIVKEGDIMEFKFNV